MFTLFSVKVLYRPDAPISKRRLRHTEIRVDTRRVCCESYDWLISVLKVSGPFVETSCVF